MAVIKSHALVTWLLSAALGTVTLLTVQAAGSAGSTSPGSAPLGAGRGAGLTQRGSGLPAGSGSGERVVYSVLGGRVWLVGDDGEVVHTFPVTGGGLTPSPGTHEVFARRLGGLGGDGVNVEHVVLFAEAGGINVGFSAAADGSMAPPDPAGQSAAIRETRQDADTMWQWATIGTSVVVVR